MSNGELKPTRKGLTLAPELWGEFSKALEQIEAEMRERGLLDHNDA